MSDKVRDDWAKQGGWAFPTSVPVHPNATNGGMTLRDYFAAHAPISYDMAQRIFGCEIDHDDSSRAAFLSVWAMLRYEYADQMLDNRKGQSK